jgi:hypothetical protein
MAERSNDQLAVRWTIGDVSPYGFEALRLSLWGAKTIFGASAKYVVCVNSVKLNVARELTGEVPEEVIWRDVTDDMPHFLLRHLDRTMSEGVAWKFAPVRLFPFRHELSLDNDCILWDMPDAIREWLNASGPRACVIAADVAPCFGQFAWRCGTEPRNSGIRGLPPAFSLEQELKLLLREEAVMLTSELDERGLQVAALLRAGRPRVVRVDKVSVCSPFPPHIPGLGSCGAHFVGLNVRELPWTLNGTPAVCHIQDMAAFAPNPLHRIGIRYIASEIRPVAVKT